MKKVNVDNIFKKKKDGWETAPPLSTTEKRLRPEEIVPKAIEESVKESIQKSMESTILKSIGDACGVKESVLLGNDPSKEITATEIARTTAKEVMMRDSYPKPMGVMADISSSGWDWRSVQGSLWANAGSAILPNAAFPAPWDSCADASYSARIVCGTAVSRTNSILDDKETDFLVCCIHTALKEGLWELPEGIDDIDSFAQKILKKLGAKYVDMHEFTEYPK